MFHITLLHYIILSAILFVIGLFGVITRKNTITVLMSIELILNAANINFVAFSKYNGFNFEGHLFTIFVIIIAAGETALALAIILNVYRRFNHVNLDEINKLQH